MKDLIIKSPTNQKFSDMDELFSWKNLLLTIVFSGLAFISNWFPILMVPLDHSLGFAIPPYRLSLMLLFVAIGAAATANLSSAIIIGLVAGLSYRNFADPGAPVINSMTLVLLTLSVSIFAGWMSVIKLREKVHGMILLVLSVLTSIPVVFASWRTEAEVTKYYHQGIGIAHGTSFNLFDIGVTLTDILTIVLLIIFWIVWYVIYLKNDANISRDEKKKYHLVGITLIVLGAIIPLASVSFLTRTFTYDTLKALGNGVNAGDVLRDVFIHQADPTFVVTETLSIYYVYLLSLNLVLFGVMLRSFGLAEGNVNPINIGSLSVYGSYVFGFTVLYLYGFKSVADILGTSNSYVLPPVAYPIYFTLVTMTFAFLVLFTLIIEIIWGNFQKEE